MQPIDCLHAEVNQLVALQQWAEAHKLFRRLLTEYNPAEWSYHRGYVTRPGFALPGATKPHLTQRSSPHLSSLIDSLFRHLASAGDGSDADALTTAVSGLSLSDGAHPS